MRLARRKGVAVTRRALVGCKIDDNAAPLQRIRQRLGWKEVSAGASRRQQNERLGHQAAFHSGGSRSADGIAETRGFSRVSANSIPIP